MTRRQSLCCVKCSLFFVASERWQEHFCSGDGAEQHWQSQEGARKGGRFVPFVATQTFKMLDPSVEWDESHVCHFWSAKLFIISALRAFELSNTAKYSRKTESPQKAEQKSYQNFAAAFQRTFGVFKQDLVEILISAARGKQRLANIRPGERARHEVVGDVVELFEYVWINTHHSQRLGFWMLTNHHHPQLHQARGGLHDNDQFGRWIQFAFAYSWRGRRHSAGFFPNSSIIWFGS